MQDFLKNKGGVKKNLNWLINHITDTGIKKTYLRRLSQNIEIEHLPKAIFATSGIFWTIKDKANLPTSSYTPAGAPCSNKNVHASERP